MLKRIEEEVFTRFGFKSMEVVEQPHVVFPVPLCKKHLKKVMKKNLLFKWSKETNTVKCFWKDEKDNIILMIIQINS
jgi:hypothetical protein